MAKDKRALFWRATYALREAESLAKLGRVVGPADAPPSDAQSEPNWIADWKARAKAALKQAADWWSEGNERLKDRAREVARQIERGGSAIVEANPLEAGKNAIDKLVSFAHELTTAMFIGEGLATLVLLWLGYELFFKRGH